MADSQFYFSIGTLATVVITTGGVVWQLTRVEKAIRDDGDLKIKSLREGFNAEIDNLQRDVVRLERAASERAETLRHEFGETGVALRTKIHEVETWNRDTFVRKDSFEMVIGRLEKSIDKLGDKIEERLDKMFERIQKSD